MKTEVKVGEWKWFRGNSRPSHDHVVICSEVGLSASTNMNSNQAVSGIWLLYLGGESGKSMSVTRFVIIFC